MRGIEIAGRVFGAFPVLICALESYCESAEVLNDLAKDNILFLHDAVHPHSTIIERPYIRREMSRTAPAQSTEAMPSLGIRLLELCFGSPLESYGYRQRLGPIQNVKIQT
jgi:hypothetical protein